MATRKASLHRKTRETDIRVSLNLDGCGKSRIRTGIGFLDHMLESMAKHGFFDIELTAKGDLHIDTHHTNEDVGIALGSAFRQALGDKKGISRFADFRAPLDEALAGARVSLDLSGRGGFYVHTSAKTRWVLDPRGRGRSGAAPEYSFLDAKHFLESFSRESGLTLHVEVVSGEHAHHVIESVFKALAMALGHAVGLDARRADVPSTKGKL